MKIAWIAAAICLLATAAGAELPTYSGWPKCLPILGFSDSEVGVAALETIARPRPVQRWVCLVIDRATLLVTPVEEADFDARFPGVRAAGNRGPNDCHEMLRPSQPIVDGAEPPACIDTRVLCPDREIPVKVSAVVLSARCPGRLFPAATLIDGRLWVAVNPLDSYYRELDGSDLVVQSPQSGAVLARRSSEKIGGRSVCAVRKDPVTGNVWVTTETGLAELTSAGAVIRTLRFAGTRAPMENRPQQ